MRSFFSKFVKSKTSKTETLADYDLASLFALDDSHFVEACYHLFLRRSPDEVGMIHFVSQMEAGTSKTDVALDIAGSEEAHAVAGGGVRYRLLIQYALSEVIDDNNAPLQSARRIEHINRFLIEGKIYVGSEAFIESDESRFAPPCPGEDTTVEQPMAVVGEYVNFSREEAGGGTLWFDLTTSFQWPLGVVGIIRAELELAAAIKKLFPAVRFTMQYKSGFAEIDAEQLQWLLQSDNVADSYMEFFGRYQNSTSASKSILLKYEDSDELTHPFKERDIVFSAGWKDSIKEHLFTKIKVSGVGIYIVYAVYDIVPLHYSTAHFYDKEATTSFRKYLRWISRNCDFIMFGGENTRLDVAAYQRENGWHSPPGSALRWGANKIVSQGSSSDEEILYQLGVSPRYILTVGTIDPRKNHSTLYRAYLYAIENYVTEMPQLVICGSPSGRVGDLIETIRRDVRVEGKIVILQATDPQLSALYRNCLFTVLPSLYEGYSLTLPESLEYGKFCLASDTPPLREIGEGMIAYVEPLDVKGWAEEISKYANDKDLLAAEEQKIKAGWRSTSWSDTGQVIIDSVCKLTNNYAPSPVRGAAETRLYDDPPTIWMDITLTYLHWSTRVTGIPRVELTYAYYLKKLYPSTRYFAYADGYFFEVLPDMLLWLFDGHDLTASYNMFLEFWKSREAAGVSFRNPFQSSGPIRNHPAYIESIPDNSIVFFVGIDYGEYKEDGSIKLYRNSDIFSLIRQDRAITTSQLVHDLTPIMFPHLHKAETCAGYRPFIEFLSRKFDHIVYGRKTALTDGIRVQKQNDWPQPMSDFVDFGTNLALRGTETSIKTDQDVKAALSKLGIEGRFIITVGTIEPRKNHETLYKAYLRMLERGSLNEPMQIIFVGALGWKSNDLYLTINADKRVRNRIIIVTPSDDELDLLYRQCMFTLLPSFYEGGSLTLSEGLSYHKFALVSDVAPLREIGAELVEYINPLDAFAWADAIAFYANNTSELEKKASNIRESWCSRSWEDSTKLLWEAMCRAHYSKQGYVDRDD